MIWKPPIDEWIKCKCDEEFSSNSNGSGGIFRNSKRDCPLAFAEPLIHVSSLNVEFFVVLRFIELNKDKGWIKL